MSIALFNKSGCLLAKYDFINMICMIYHELFIIITCLLLIRRFMFYILIYQRYIDMSCKFYSALLYVYAVDSLLYNCCNILYR